MFIYDTKFYIIYVSYQYEEDIKDEKLLISRRNKLPKSSVDDSFFNLAEMEAFLDAQDKVEETRQKTGRNLGEFDSAQEVKIATL